jgi:hypothetical protein
MVADVLLIACVALAYTLVGLVAVLCIVKAHDAVEVLHG